MKLLIDAGNTRIKWALAGDTETEGWLQSGVLPTGQADELPGLFAGLGEVSRVWASNVAGEAVARHIHAASEKISAPLHFAVVREAQCGVRNGYSNPAQLGTDRWLALIAAWHRVRGVCLVVNSGTATTIDALSAGGEFIGGLILPGVELMRRSLAEATAGLPVPSGTTEEAHGVSFPLNTADAIYSGALQATCGAIERQHTLLGNAAAPVVLSGGAAAMLQGQLNVPVRIVDNPVLRGLLLIARETGTQ